MTTKHITPQEAFDMVSKWAGRMNVWREVTDRRIKDLYILVALQTVVMALLTFYVLSGGVW